MDSKKALGFTIVETMLFLAITGALVAGVMVSTGSSINNQRYKDSTASLQSYLQKFFSEAVNVSNDERNILQKYSCDSEAKVVLNGSNVSPRGQSDCLILGKLITPDSTNNSKLKIATVVGVPPVIASNSSDDTTVLQGYKISSVPDTIMGDSFEIEWGGELKRPDGSNNTNSKFSILLIKSPTSNITRAYVNDSSVASDPMTLIKPIYLDPKKPAVMCVDLGGMYNSEKMAIVVNANSTSAAGIELYSNTGLAGLSLKLGTTYRC